MNMSKDQRPKRFGWAPGNYVFWCRDCANNNGLDRLCIGSKRARMCADCAYALPDPQPSVPFMWGDLQGEFR